MVTTRQLTAAGLSDHAIRHRVHRGVLTRLHHGVYRAGPLSTPTTVAAAAVLACGPGAALSHLWAAALWDIAPWPEGTVSVTSRRVRTRPGIRLHRTSDPDTTRHHGIPVTRPTRTLLDLATVLSARDLDRAVSEAFARRLTTRAVLDAVVRRHAGRPGAPALRATLRAAPGFTRSEAERRLLVLVRRSRLPAPRTNVHVEGHEVDALWPQQRLVAEVDGRTYHDSPRRFETDRSRDAHLAAAGYVVLRFTWRQLTTEPEVVVARLAAALARR